MHSLRRYDWIVHLTAIALCCYFLAQAVATYVAGLLEELPSTQPVIATRSTPSTPLEKVTSLEDYQIIAERNIFNAAESGSLTDTGSEEMGSEQLGELGPAVKTTLDIKLLATLVVGDGSDRRSSAVVAGEKGSKADSYYPGDEKAFAPNARLIKVAKDRIEFVHGGKLEYAELEDFASAKSIFGLSEEVHGKAVAVNDKTKPDSGQAGEGKITIDQKEVDEALQNLDKLMTEIRIVPNFKEGQQAGMKVLSVKPGSVIAKLGIKRGDVLEKVNGKDLDIRQGLELFNQMKDLKNFSLDVVRGGRNQTLEYEIR